MNPRLTTLLLTISSSLFGATIGQPAAANGLCPPWPAGPQAVLAGGGVIAGAVAEIDGSTITLRSLTFGAVRLPRDTVAGWRSSLSADRDAFARAGDATAPAPDAGRSVILRFDNGDVLRATAIQADEATATVTVPQADLPLSIRLERLRSIDFSATAAASATPVTIVATADGSRIPTVASTPLDGGRTRLSLATFGTPSLECDTTLIVATALRGGGVRPLQSLPMIGDVDLEKPAPANAIAWSRSLHGGPLRARGDNAFDGFAVQAPARLRFRIDPPADRFTARVAIDDAAGQGGGVRATVRTGGPDGPPVTRFESGLLRGGEAAVPIDVVCPGMTLLEIALESVGDDVSLDRTVWLDPVVTRSEAR